MAFSLPRINVRDLFNAPPKASTGKSSSSSKQGFDAGAVSARKNKLIPAPPLIVGDASGACRAVSSAAFLVGIPNKGSQENRRPSADTIETCDIWGGNSQLPSPSNAGLRAAANSGAGGARGLSQHGFLLSSLSQAQQAGAGGVAGQFGTTTAQHAAAAGLNSHPSGPVLPTHLESKLSESNLDPLGHDEDNTATAHDDDVKSAARKEAAVAAATQQGAGLSYYTPPRAGLFTRTGLHHLPAHLSLSGNVAVGSSKQRRTQAAFFGPGGAGGGAVASSSSRNSGAVSGSCGTTLNTNAAATTAGSSSLVLQDSSSPKRPQQMTGFAPADALPTAHNQSQSLHGCTRQQEQHFGFGGRMSSSPSGQHAGSAAAKAMNPNPPPPAIERFTARVQPPPAVPQGGGALQRTPSDLSRSTALKMQHMAGGPGGMVVAATSSSGTAPAAAHSTSGGAVPQQFSTTTLPPLVVAVAGGGGPVASSGTPATVVTTSSKDPSLIKIVAPGGGGHHIAGAAPVHPGAVAAGAAVNVKPGANMMSPEDRSTRDTSKDTSKLGTANSSGVVTTDCSRRPSFSTMGGRSSGVVTVEHSRRPSAKLSDVREQSKETSSSGSNNNAVAGTSSAKMPSSLPTLLTVDKDKKIFNQPRQQAFWYTPANNQNRGPRLDPIWYAKKTTMPATSLDCQPITQELLARMEAMPPVVVQDKQKPREIRRLLGQHGGPFTTKAEGIKKVDGEWKSVRQCTPVLGERKDMAQQLYDKLAKLS